MPEYYFAVSKLAEYENGNLADAYVKVDFPYEASQNDVMEFAVAIMPSLRDRLRPISHAEYEQNAEEDAVWKRVY